MRSFLPDLHRLGADVCHCAKPVSCSVFYYSPNVIFLPKGARESPAILKCCLPKGMPMMVMQSSVPNRMCIRQAQSPPKIIQRMLRGMRMQPIELSHSSTLEPKGHRQSRPSLNVCSATGMPIIVTNMARN